MTPAERQRRRREKLRAEVRPDDVVASVVAQLDRAPAKVAGEIMRRLTREIAKRQRKPAK
jgi:hypothetical protein